MANEPLWAQCNLTLPSTASVAFGHPNQFQWTAEGIKSQIPVSTVKQSANLFLHCNSDTLQWLETTLYLDFNPSSINYVDIVYRCDSSLQTGWILRMGDVEDGLKLIERKAGKERLECMGEPGYFNKSKSNITLRWVKQNNLLLILYKDSSWEQYRTLCAAIDTLKTIHNYVGLTITQTGSGAAGKHRVNSFSVTPPRPDITPPTIQSLLWKSTSTAEIQFSEPIFIENKNQLICQHQQALSYLQPNKKTLIAQFNPQPCNTYQTVYVQNVKDSASNIQPLQQKGDFVYCPTPINTHEITITEIMADPLPNRGFLPPVQYIELKNNTRNALWLDELTLSDLHTTTNLPKILLAPQQRITLCHHSDTPQMKNIPHVVGCNLPHLNIESETLTLTNKQNQTVHRFEYQQFMQHPGYDDGGYSLEHIDTQTYCVDLFKWHSNTTLGGTPSLPPSNYKPFPTAKSTQPSLDVPFAVAYLAATFPDTAVIEFTHPVDGQLPKMQSKTVGSTHAFTPLSGGKYHISPPLQNQQLLTVAIDSLIDCNGQNISQQTLSLGYAASIPQPGDLQFNEVMFNSLDHLTDFVEIVNTSQKPQQLQGLQLKIGNALQPEETTTLTNHPFVLYPGEIRCFSVQPYPIVLANNPRYFYRHQQVPNFPNLPATGATLHLTHPMGTLIDEMIYRESMHTPILTSTKGVSLEKTSPNAPSNQAMHWVSATATVGNSTPGETNSQCTQQRKSPPKVFQLEKMVVHCEHEEYIALLHQLPKAGYVVKLSLYSMWGSVIPLEISPTQVSQDGQLLIPLWKVKNVLPGGNYVLHVEAFHPDADICRQNLRLVLVH